MVVGQVCVLVAVSPLVPLDSEQEQASSRIFDLLDQSCPLDE